MLDLYSHQRFLFAFMPAFGGPQILVYVHCGSNQIYVRIGVSLVGGGWASWAFGRLRLHSSARPPLRSNHSLWAFSILPLLRS